MNLSWMLAEREEQGRPVRVGVIGAGKFGSMFLSQASRTRGLHVVGIVDWNVARARESLARIGWPEEQYSARSFASALESGGSYVLDDAEALIACDDIDVVVEATGNRDHCWHAGQRRRVSFILLPMATSRR
jgi:predicted homoserine dehydrogenase-like protein